MGLSVVLPLLAATLTFALWRGKAGRSVWWVVVGLQALLVGGAVVSLNTGERDEDRVEAVAPKAAIEAHEDAAKQFTVAAVVALAVAGAGLLRKEPGWLRASAVTTTAVSLLVLGMGLRVGHAGGELVYAYNAAAAHRAGTAAHEETATKTRSALVEGERHDPDDDD